MNPQELMLAFLIKIAKSDGHFAENEMVAIGSIVRRLPFFDDFSGDGLKTYLGENYEKVEMLETGAILHEMANSMSQHQKDLAFILACTVIASDGELNDGELNMLHETAQSIGVSAYIPANGIEIALTLFQGPDGRLKL